MAKTKKTLEDLNKKYGIKGSTATSKNDNRKQTSSASSKNSTTTKEKSSTNKPKKTLEDLNKQYGITGKTTPSSQLSPTTKKKKYTDFNSETQNAYTSAKDKVTSKTTIKSTMSDDERKARIKSINGELSTLKSKMSGYSRAAAYGTNKAMAEAKKKDEARIAELTQKLKSLERVGTFSASELKQFEIDDAKAKVSSARQKVNSYGARPTAASAESYKKANSELYNAREELELLERQKTLYDDISKYGDVVHKEGKEQSEAFTKPVRDFFTKVDDFESQWRANYRSNELSREADKAMSEYLTNPTEENKQIAYAYDAFAKAYAKNNEEALDDENVVAPWLTKSAAGYLPQFKDQIVPEAIGYGVGALVGGAIGMPTLGASVGSAMGTFSQSYGVMRGSVYRTLLAEGVDEETALQAATDEALISSLIESGETAASVLLSGGIGAFKAIGKAATASVAKGSTNAATKFVANLATKATANATTKAATKAAADVTRPLWSKGIRLVGGIVGNGLSEYGEEFSQGAVSEANREKALATVEKEIGRYGEGNIDLYNRPIYKNSDGTISTVDSVTFEVDGKYVVLPTIVRDVNGNAKRLESDEEIFAHYEKTGEYLGEFDTLEEANGYAQKVHSAQAYYYDDKTVNAGDNLWSGGAKVIKDAVFGGDTETLSELHEQGMEGFKIGVMFGGTNATVNNIVSHYANAKTVKIQNEVIDDLLANEEDLKSLIESGKASGEGTVSAKIAIEIETAMENGKEVTREQVKQLLETNEVYKNAEVTTSETDPLEQAAREVVEERNNLDGRTLLEARKRGEVTAQILERLSQVNAPITNEEAKKVTGFGDRGAELVAKSANAEGATFYDTVAQLKPSYISGFNNPDMDIKKVAHTFDSQAQQDAYTAGQQDAIMQNSVAEAKAKNARVFGAESGVIENEHSAKYSPNQLKMGEKIGKDLSVQVSFEEQLIIDEEKGYEANAWYHNGEIKRSSTSKNKFIEDIIEESLHRMSEINTEAVQVLNRAAYEFVAERERSLGVEGKRFDEEKALYEDNEQSINTRGIMEEVSVGVLSTELFKNEKQWLRWRERLDTDSKLRQAWYKLMDFVSEIIEKIERLLAEGSFSKETRAKVNKDIADLKRLKGLYTEAYIATKDAVSDKANNQSAEVQTETRTEATSSPVASENTSTNKETPAKAKNKPQAKNKAVKVGETYTANATGKTYTVTERNDTHTTYTVTDKNGKTTTRKITNTAADINFNRAGEEGFTKVNVSNGIKAGDVFVAKETGTQYKIVSRDDKNTKVEISSEEGTKTMVISNEIADSNFSNMSAEGITKWIDEDMHIDNRTWEDVGDRKVKAFQFLVPEMQEYYRPLAQELLGDLDNTIEGERIKIGSYEMNNEEWTGIERFTSEAIATIKDSTNATYDDIRNALNRLINDEGQENIALAKRIELVLDDMLTNGYNTFEGEQIPPNEEYITKKEALIGKTYEGKKTDAAWDEDYLDDLVAWGNAKFSLKNKNLTANSRIPFTVLNNYIKVTNNNYPTLKKLEKEVKNLKRDIYQNDATGYRARITSNTIGKAIRPSDDEDFNPFTTEHIRNLNAIRMIPELFKKAVYVDSMPPQKGKSQNPSFKEFHHFVAPIFMDNGEYRAIITAREKVNSNTLYVLKVEILPTQKRHTLLTAQQKNAVGSQSVSVPSDISIPELVNGVKIFDYNTRKDNIYTSADIKYSLKDSEGKTLTTEQAEYFKDSKVRDENGNLLVMYHGTSEDFTVFDKKKARASGTYGSGFYFTRESSHANHYGEAKKYYLKIDNPLSTKEKTITKAQLKKFLEVIAKDEDYGLENYGYGSTVESVIDKIYDDSDTTRPEYSKTDFSILQDVNITAIGNMAEAVELFNKVNGTNFDGFILPTETVTFNSEQAKLTTNKKPTSNPDVRFSLKNPVEETKNLIAVHNMQVSELERTLDLGGLPMPSIAIIKAQSGHSEYGDVSLVFNKGTIDPKSNKDNKVYGGDAWTPTYPTIEYKPNEKVAGKISDKYYELSKKYGYDESRPLYNYVHDLERQLNTNKGEASMIEELYDNTNLMQLYLLDSGKEKVETVKKETRKELTDAEVEMNEFFINELGADVVDEVKWDGNGTPIEHRKNYMSKYGEAMREAYKKLLSEVYQFSDEQVQNVLDSTKPANYLKFVRDAYNYRHNGRVTIMVEDDFGATDKAIREAAGEGYRNWVDSLFKGIEEKSGIRNNVGYFTNNGNRRSWEALHWENNLENVVKVMKSESDVGSGTFFAAHSIWGVSAKNYGSIEEIKADSGRLKQLPEEEYNKIKEGFGERLTEIAQSIMDKSERNPFMAVDNAMECIVDAVRNSKTKSGILNNLRQYRQLTVTETTVDDIVSLVSDIANMPTEYFEAKPKRAVELNEIATAIIPDNTSQTTKTRLDDMGIKYLEYESGNENARLEALNSLEDAKFSLKGGISAMEYLNTLEAAQKGKKGAAEKLAKYVENGMIRTTTYDELIEKYGVIPAGEKPHREVQVPRKSGKNKKVSQTIRTILEAKVTPDEAVPTIEKMVEDGLFSYDVYTDKQALSDAKEYIKTYGWDESLDDWFDAVNKGEVSKELTTMGWALYNNAANIATTTTSETERTTAIKTSLKILDAMVKHQRSAAQALQATRILKKLSPETQLYGIQKSVQAFQNELVEKYGDKAPNLQIDEELVEEFINAKTPEERAKVEEEIYKDIGRQMPSRFIDKWNAWRYLAMLGNVRTHVRNVFGNMFFAPVVATKNLTATAIESMVAPVVRLSGREMLRGKSIVWGNKADRALLEAAWNDYGNVADMISNGGKYNDSAMANKSIQEGRQIFKFKPLEWARKKNSELLEREDTLFSKPHYAYALAQYCKANNITPEQIRRGKAIAPARDYAIKEAQKATYRDTNAFSQMVSEWGRSNKNEKNIAKKAFNTVIEGILPFRKTPANILVRGVEYSPLGLLKGLSYDLYQVSKGKMLATEAIDNISAGLTGTELVALGVYLAAQGLVRGHGEDEEEKKFKELMGHQAYSLELPNGESITLDWLAPEALPFFIGVNIWEATKGSDEEVNLSTILQSVSHISEPMLEMSCLQGLNDLFEGIGYASSNDTSGLVSVVSSAATSYLMQGIPTIFGQIERTGEEERMTTYTEKNDFLTGDVQYTLGKASAKIPYWDYNQIPYIDAWGRKEASGTALKRGLNNFLNPAYTSTIETSRMEEELLRLYERTRDGGVFPERADKYFMIDGERKDLTADEYVRYATLKGEKSYKAVSDLVNSRAYQKLSNEEKAKAVKEAYDYANQKAKEAISNYEPQSWVAKADEFGYNVGNYLAFKTEVASTKEANDDKITKQQVADIILDMAQNDSETWKMYLSMYDSEGDKYAYDKGVSGKDYMYFIEALKDVDEPSKSGKYGSYTQDEARWAVNRLDGLSRQEKAILWQSVNTTWKKNPYR